MSWRTQGEKSIPDYSGKAPRAKTKAAYDKTYGAEDDMLDKHGIIVEPDVREKISKYFKMMGLREWIREIILSQ